MYVVYIIGVCVMLCGKDIINKIFYLRSSNGGCYDVVLQ